MKLTLKQQKIIEAKRLLSIELRKKYMQEYQKKYYPNVLKPKRNKLRIQKKTINKPESTENDNK